MFKVQGDNVAMNTRQYELLRDAEILLRQGEERLARVRRLVEAMRDEETVGEGDPVLCRCETCPTHGRAGGWETTALDAALRWLA